VALLPLLLLLVGSILADDTAPHEPTPVELFDVIANMIKVNGEPPHVLIDLGCGNASVAIAAAVRGAARHILCIERNRALLDQGEARSKMLGVSGMIEFIEADMFSSQVSALITGAAAPPSTVAVYTYLIPAMMAEVTSLALRTTPHVFLVQDYALVGVRPKRMVQLSGLHDKTRIMGKPLAVMYQYQWRDGAATICTDDTYEQTLHLAPGADSVDSIRFLAPLWLPTSVSAVPPLDVTILGSNGSSVWGIWIVNPNDWGPELFPIDVTVARETVGRDGQKEDVVEITTRMFRPSSDQKESLTGTFPVPLTLPVTLVVTMEYAWGGSAEI